MLIHFRHFLVTLLLISICGCTYNSRHKEMRSLLQQAQKQNQDYIPFTTDSIGKILVRYYDRHGSNNDKMLAHYVLGCMYRDMNEAPMALQCYQDAIDKADTTRADCDYGLLCRINGQIAELFHKEFMPERALYYNDRACHFAELDNDTVTALIFREQIACDYGLLHQDEKSLRLFEDTYRRFKSVGKDDDALITLGLTIYHLVAKGEYEQAKRNMDMYETCSFFDENKNIIPGKEMHYVTKGRYYMAVNKLDSAELTIRRAIKHGKSTNIQLAAHNALLQLFKKKANTDSIAKYAQLCFALDDTVFVHNSRDILMNINSLYQYGRNQELAVRMEKKAGRTRQYLLISAFIILLLVLSAVYAWFRYRSHQKKLLEQYENDKEELVAAQKELLEMEEMRYDQIIKEKTEYIETLKTRIRNYEETHGNIFTVDIVFAEADICRRFHAVASKRRELPTANDWEELSNLIDKEIPSFYAIVNSRQTLKEQEYNICMLVRTHFQMSEICNLMSMSSASLSMQKKRLHTKIFNVEGGAREFDSRIKGIS